MRGECVYCIVPTTDIRVLLKRAPLIFQRDNHAYDSRGLSMLGHWYHCRCRSRSRCRCCHCCRPFWRFYYYKPCCAYYITTQKLLAHASSYAGGRGRSSSSRQSRGRREEGVWKELETVDGAWSVTQLSLIN